MNPVKKPAKFFEFFIIFYILLFLFFSQRVFSHDYSIYSISHDLPMGEDEPYAKLNMKKNYYVKMGSRQGARLHQILRVLRHTSVVDAYSSKRRFSHEVPIGFLKVIHVSEHSLIAIPYTPNPHKKQMTSDEESKKTAEKDNALENKGSKWMKNLKQNLQELAWFESSSREGDEEFEWIPQDFIPEVSSFMIGDRVDIFLGHS
jgi:hypothetical protein